jgi:TRAP-type C4-dicarboxylate transport system permease small subunit
MLGEGGKKILGWVLEICMLGTNLFMLWWGLKLVHTTWFQVIAEFPIMSVGLSYLPIPLAGGLTALFIIERMLTQEFFKEPDAETISQLTTE